MEPATMQYQSCDDNGLVCWSTSIENILEDNQAISIVGVDEESNFKLLLNIDHFYRDQCANELGIVGLVTREMQSTWNQCLVKKMEKTIHARNKENLEYLKKIKENFDQD